MNVRPVEVATFEEEGLETRLGDIQLGRMPLSLAKTAKRIEGGPCHFVVGRHHDNSGVLHPYGLSTFGEHGGSTTGAHAHGDTFHRWI